MYIISNFHNNPAFVVEETDLVENKFREVKVLAQGHSLVSGDLLVWFQVCFASTPTFVLQYYPCCPWKVILRVHWSSMPMSPLWSPQKSHLFPFKKGNMFVFLFFNDKRHSWKKFLKKYFLAFANFYSQVNLPVFSLNYFFLKLKSISSCYKWKC